MAFDMIRFWTSMHKRRGEWCSCGETAEGCFILSVFLVAYQRWGEEKYEQIFAREVKS